MAIATILSLFLLFVGRLASHQQNLSAKQMVCLLSELLWELHSVALAMYLQFKASDVWSIFLIPGGKAVFGKVSGSNCSSTSPASWLFHSSTGLIFSIANSSRIPSVFTFPLSVQGLC